MTAHFTPRPSLLDRLATTEREVVVALKTLGEADAERLARHLHLSLSAIRGSLQVLRASGYVQIRREGHGVGRKRFYYSLTEEGNRLFPGPPDGYAIRFFGDLARRAPELFRELISDLAGDYAQRAMAAWSGLPEEDRIAAVVEAWRQAGYLVDGEPDGHSGGELRLYHCPFRALVDNDAWLCDREADIIGAGANATVQRTHHQPAGDRFCRYVLQFRGERDVASPGDDAPATQSAV